MRILITGGAGFIGSVTCAYLLDQGFQVNVLDNLSTGHKKLVDKRANFFLGDILDRASIEIAMSGCDAVVHLAGKAIVSESILKPDLYLESNHIGTRNILNSMEKLKVCKLVFSSTCAVYGNPNSESIAEDHSTKPINPYGKSKLLADIEINRFSNRNKINAVSLRFFNVGGSYKNSGNNLFGELHEHETHLIPRIIKNKSVDIYGTDFETVDGTCVRDYVHVVDLARAIKLCLEEQGIVNHKIYNLGSGSGSSVLEVVSEVEKVLSSKIKINKSSRRVGDPSILVANSKLANAEIGWESQIKLGGIVKDSFTFIHAQV